MSDTTTPSPSSEATEYPLGPRPYKYKPVCARSRSAPSVAFGFLLDIHCRLRWAKWFHEYLFGPEELEGKTPEEVHQTLTDMELAIPGVLPGLIYSEFPDLYPLRNSILPIVESDPDVQRYVFVLRDNATWQGMKAPLTAEVTEGVRQRLGVGDVEPNWYRIDFNAR